MNELRDKLLGRYKASACDLEITEEQRAVSYRVTLALPDTVFRLAERLALAKGTIPTPAAWPL